MFEPNRWAAITAFVATIGLPGLAAAATLNVPQDCPTIQGCIDAAVSGVDECVVAPGTYPETINFLGKAITLRSAGGADVTTIDATGIGGSVVTCASGEGPDTVLDGFTITGGTGTPSYPGSVYLDGGGMYNYGSSPMVTNCTFSGNTASDSGAGMYNDNNSNPTVSNCTFSGNTASGGGGMANLGGRVMVSNCTFSDNSAIGNVGYGGGIYNNGASPTLRNCTFTGNIANHGGGMFNEFSSPILTNCKFRINSARSGGGMLNIYWSSPRVTNCAISENSANPGSGGGVLNSSHSSPRVTNCTFSRNTADSGGGGMSVIFDSSPTLANCTFMGNLADQGGGMDIFSSSNPNMANCILWDNSASSGTGESAQIHTISSTPVVNYSIVQGGWSGAGGTAVVDADPLFADADGQDGIPGTEDDNLRLFRRSPAIDAGTNDAVPPDAGDLDGDGDTTEPTPLDFDSHARILCGRVDMGAYEFGIGDHNCDQAVNLNDFTAWRGCMIGPEDGASGDAPYALGCEAFDFDGDLDMDLLDFGGFQTTFAP